MNNRAYHSLMLLLLIALGGCNQADSKTQILLRCTILADEAKHYGSANYVRLFYAINPQKFAITYKKTADFDNKSHLTIINTYMSAVERIKTEDIKAQALMSAAQKIAQFVQHFVDYDYATAIALKQSSQYDPKSDNFFMEINDIIKFDPDIANFDNNKASFKGLLKKYNIALKVYSES